MVVFRVLALLRFARKRSDVRFVGQRVQMSGFPCELVRREGGGGFKGGGGRELFPFPLPLWKLRRSLHNVVIHNKPLANVGLHGIDHLESFGKVGAGTQLVVLVYG